MSCAQNNRSGTSGGHSPGPSSRSSWLQLIVYNVSTFTWSSSIYNTSSNPRLIQFVRHALLIPTLNLPLLITAMSATAVSCAPPFVDPTNPMSDYSYWQVQNWMLAMSNYPPPPPPEHSHYNALYPTSGGAQQLLDPVQQEQLQFDSLNTPAYPKIESGSPSQSSSTQIQGLAHELSTHAGSLQWHLGFPIACESIYLVCIRFAKMPRYVDSMRHVGRNSLAVHANHGIGSDPFLSNKTDLRCMLCSYAKALRQIRDMFYSCLLEAVRCPSFALCLVMIA